MKKLLFIIAIITSITAKSQENWSYQIDKQIHTYVGFGMGSATSATMMNANQPYIRATLAPLIISTPYIIGKELYDVNFKKNGIFSVQDIVYSYSGVLFGSITTTSTYLLSDFMLSKKRFGSKDSYSVPVFLATGFYFLNELALWGFVKKYKPSRLNVIAGGVTQSLNMMVKYIIDKKNGKHDFSKFGLERFKL